MRHEDLGALGFGVFVLLMIAALVMASIWNKRQAQRWDAISEARAAEIDAEAKRRESAAEERKRHLDEVEEQLRGLGLRIEAIIRKREGRERMRSMARKARMTRRRINSRKPWPLVAGQKAINQADDREWKARRNEGHPKQILHLGRFQLWRHPTR